MTTESSNHPMNTKQGNLIIFHAVSLTERCIDVLMYSHKWGEDFSSKHLTGQVSHAQSVVTLFLPSTVYILCIFAVFALSFNAFSAFRK